MSMDPNKFSPNSIEDEQFNKGVSGMKSETGENNIHRLQKYDETGHNVEITKGSSSTAENENLKMQESRSSVLLTVKNLASNSSFTLDSNNLKTSESLLSLLSTTALRGTSSSDITSSEEEPLDDLEDISEKRESDHNGSTRSSNQHYEETSHSTGFITAPKSKIENKSLKVQDSRSSISTDSESNTSLTVDEENLKTLQSRLSLISTFETCGSSSSDIASSQEKSLAHLEDISEKRETDNNDSTQSYNQQYEEISHSTGFITAPKNKIENKSLKVQDSRSSISTDSERNTSLTVDEDNLKTLQSMLSLISTCETCGSSSSVITSSEEKSLAHLEDISEKRETDNNDSTQSYDRNDKKCNKTDGSAGFTMGSGTKEQNESLRVQEGRSISTTSESNISSTDDEKNLKTSESMLSFASIIAICGSSSSDITSSEEEPMGDISEDREADNNVSTQSYDQQYEETGSTDFTKGSRSKEQNANSEVKEGASSISTIVNDSESNISQTLHSGNLKTSESMLSFSSTAAIYGSSSSDIASSEDEPLNSLEDRNEKPELENIRYAENRILGLPRKAVQKISNSPSIISFSDTNLDNESQTDYFEFTRAIASFFQEGSNSLKSSDMKYGLDADDLPSLSRRSLSECVRTEEFPSKKPLSSTLDRYVDIEEPSSNNNIIDIPPLERIPSSLITREVETSVISDCGTTPGVVDWNSNLENYCQKEDKSVRRKFKTETPTSPSKTDSLPNSFLAPWIPGSSRKFGLSLFEGTSSEEVDLDLYELCGQSGEVEYFVPKPRVEELLSSWPEIPTSDAGRGLKPESCGKSTNNCGDKDENMSSKESEHQIITSKQLSDEFSARLLSYEKIMKECLKNIERYTSPNLKNPLELEEMCNMLMEFCIPENIFIEFVGREFLAMSGRECDVESIRETSNQDRQDYYDGLLFSIKEDFDLFAMVKLYAKLMYKGATYVSVLNESKNPTAAEESFRYRDLLSVVQNSRADIYGRGIVTQNETFDFGCPFSSKGDILQKDISSISRESTETSNVLSMPDSNKLDSVASAENEPGNEKIPFSANEASKQLVLSDELETVYDGKCPKVDRT